MQYSTNSNLETDFDWIWFFYVNIQNESEFQAEFPVSITVHFSTLAFPPWGVDWIVLPI